MKTLTLGKIENGYMVQVNNVGTIGPGPIHYAKDYDALFALVERLLEEIHGTKVFPGGQA